MPTLPEFSSVLDIRYGQDPALDAWLLHFMTVNNLEYSLDPFHNASDEQLRFMVALEPDTVFVPCSDRMLLQLMKPTPARHLVEEYLGKWRTIVHLARTSVPDRYTLRRLLGLCRHTFRLYLASHILIPSRLTKRLTTIVLTQSGQDDPFRERKRLRNRQARDFVDSAECRSLLDACPSPPPPCEGLDSLRFELHLLELQRLLCLSTLPEVVRVHAPDGRQRLEREMLGIQPGIDPLRDILGRTREPMKILYLPSSSGGLIFDLMVIRSLLRMGHRVVLALKEGFYYHYATFWDREHDPVLAEALAGARFIQDDRISKNALLKELRENPFVVISDGTRERLNLYRTSVTFARAWKESDLVLAKGEPCYHRLITASHAFTRDILCFYRDAGGGFHMDYKPKADWVVKFSEGGLNQRAAEIIGRMREARVAGRTVMFYSGIIGSVPGQTRTAIKVMNTLVRYLRSRLESVLIINPAEHFEEGMDADDLMFMWEQVQRSGLISVWRFQTVEDIEKSFELMHRKVPPAWAGKDATYSTGCTKEMHIALDMQQRYPELQIIGPDPEKFFRRREYGVGKFCDVAVDECA